MISASKDIWSESRDGRFGTVGDRRSGFAGAGKPGAAQDCTEGLEELGGTHFPHGSIDCGAGLYEIVVIVGVIIIVFFVFVVGVVIEIEFGRFLPVVTAISRGDGALPVFFE